MDNLQTIQPKTRWIFAFAGLGKDAMFAMSTIMLFYFNALLGISSAFLGTMMMLARIWDAINDPIMGGIVSNTKSRFGKFRPWILIGSVLNGVVLIILFSNPSFGSNSFQMLAFVSVFYVLWGMTYTLMDIPFWSMIPALSQSQKEREKITVLTRLFTSIGYFIIAAAFLDLASLLGGGTTEVARIQGFFVLSILVAVVFILSELFMVMNVKENVVVKEEEIITLKKMFQLLKQNDQLLVVMGVVLIANFTLYVTSGMAIYFITYDIGNEGLYIIFIGAGGILQVIGSLMFPLLKIKFNRKGIFNVAMGLQLLGFALLLVNAFVLSNVVFLLFAFGALIFLGQGFQMVLQTVLLSDTVEYGEYLTHQRSEALAFSVQTFIVKLAMGLSLGVIGIGLALFQFATPIEVNGEIITQPQSTVTLVGMRLLMFLVPMIGLSISLWLFNKKHTLNETRYEDIVRQLRARGEYDETPSAK